MDEKRFAYCAIVKVIGIGIMIALHSRVDGGLALSRHLSHIVC